MDANVPEYPLAQAREQPLQPHLIHIRFEQVVIGAKAECLPDKLKFIIAGEGHRHRDVGLLTQRPHQLQTAHARHFHVGNQQVNGMVLQKAQRLIAIAAIPHHAVSVALPVDQRTQCHVHQRVVIHDQGSYHKRPPPFGYRPITAASAQSG